ncbi:MAG: HesA/MoeB/ThiF family protein [Candidatus Izemoplasmataceae bacterium]
MDFHEANRKLLGDDTVASLGKLSVLLVGAGGLGGYVANGLIRLGVGKLTIVDMDTYETSNLNRQLFSSIETIGAYKAEVVRDSCLEINPEASITAYLKPVETLDEKLAEVPFDLVIDAVDTVATRLFLETFSSRKGVPLLHGAIGGWYGQIGIAMPGSGLLSRIYGDKEAGLEKTLGSPTFTPGVVGCMMVSECVKYVLKDERALINRILFIDLLHHDYEVIYESSK